MKKLFAILMSVLMIACFMPTMAFAESTSTVLSETELRDFFKVDGTYTLGKDLDISQASVSVPTGVTVTLDLKGKTLSAANTEEGSIVVNGTLILKDSGTDGKIQAATPYVNGTADKPVIRVMGQGKFIMHSGKIETVVEPDTSNKGQFGVGLYNDALIEINGGQIESGWYAISSNGSLSGNGKIVVNDGELISTADYAIYAAQKGESVVEVNGGTIYGQAGGIALNAGKLSVNGGLITSKGQGSTGTWGDGTGGLGNAAININAKYDVVDAKITDGVVTAEGDAVVIAKNTAKEATLSITGGAFSSDVSEYVPSGMETVQGDDGKYTIKAKDDAVAKIGNAYYATLQDAVNAVEAGPAKQFGSNATTITLLKDTNAGLDIGDSQGKTPKNIILDLNNNTLTLGPAVGSKNTETNGIRTLAYSQTEIKNGKIVCSDIMNDKGNYVMCGLANYGKLTLDNVYVQSSNHVQYTINNRGELTLKGKTTVEAGSYGTGNFQDLAIANEVYNAYYENQPLNAKVICDSKDVTVGKMSIEHKAIYTGNPDAQIELAISAGTFGEIWDADASKEDLTPIIGNITGGTFASDPTPYVADNYKGTQSNGSWTVSKKSSSSGGGSSSAVTELDKVKAEANTALSNAAAANKYDDAEQAEVKSILEKATADIKAAKTEAEVKAIQEAAQAEIDKILTSGEKAEIEAVTGVSSDVFKAKSKLSKLNGKKAIKVTWNVPGEMKLDGYEVFRSTKRYSGFGTEPYFTTSKTSYTNNKELKAGKTYYYKVRGFVEINGVKYYTKFSTKAFRTIK